MAQDLKARWVVVNFRATENGKTVGHGLRMKVGTANALGLSSSDFTPGFVEKQVKASTTRRRLYPGHGGISVSKPAQTQAVAVGPRQTAARTNQKLILKGDGTNKEATIYYTGKRATVLKWLDDHTTIDHTLFGNSMAIYSPRGKRLSLKKALIA